jgi:hypothetical protein
MQRTVAILATTTLIAGSAAIYLWQQLQSERRLTSHLQQQAPPPSRLQVQEQQTSAAEVQAPSPAGGPGQQPVDTMAVPARACALLPTEVLDQLLPHLRGELKTMARQVTAKNYPGVAEELGLTEAETTALLDLLQKHQTLQNFMPEAYTSSDDTIRQEIERANVEIPKMQNAELVALLGPGKYGKWQEYQPTLKAHRQLNLLLRNNRSSMPELSEQQTKSLVAAIAAEQTRLAGGTKVPRSTSVTPSSQLDQEENDIKVKEESNARILEAARLYLSEQQYTAVKETMTRLARSDLGRLQARRTQLEGGGGK